MQRALPFCICMWQKKIWAESSASRAGLQRIRTIMRAGAARENLKVAVEID